MGLFNKLKNALFEEEEIEIPINEVPESKPINVVKEEKIEKKIEPPKKSIDTLLDEENERDLFKAENTFKFPEFDEEEFKTSYKPPIEKEEKVEPVITPKESPTRVKPITYEYDKKPKQTRKETLKKEVKEESNQKKTFRPSPVISPVYGVLDKNYRKEDIITVKEEKPKKVFDVDEIRKKAFGTLEDDIERSFEEPKETFYRNSKNIDDLLNDSTDEKIEIDYETPRNSRESRNEIHSRVRTASRDLEEDEVEPRRTRHTEEEKTREEKNHYNQLEQEIEDTNTLQVLDEEPSKSEEQRFEEDTLENDLFDLIDSMYDNREEDDE